MIEMSCCKVIAASSTARRGASLAAVLFALVAPVALGVNFKALLEVGEQLAKHGDEIADAAHLAKAATLVPESVVDEAARAAGLGDSLPGMAEKLREALKSVEHMGKPRLALSLTEKASDLAKGAARSGSMDELQHALSLLYLGKDAIRRSEVIRFAQEPSAELARAFQARAANGERLLTNMDVLVMGSRTRTEVLPLALEVGNEYLRLLEEFSELSVLALGRKGPEAQQAALQALERLRDAAESWRWVEDAYLHAAPAASKSLDDQLRAAAGIALYGEDVSNARRFLAVARGETPPPTLGSLKAAPPPSPVAPPAPVASKSLPREVAVELATRERRLIAAERMQVPLPPLFSQQLALLERLVTHESKAPQRVKVVKKPWAENWSEAFLRLMAQLLIEALVLAALVILVCPLLFVAAWVALFYLRRNQLRMELYSSDGSTALKGRTELAGFARCLCVVCGWMGKVGVYAAVFFLAAIVVWPVGIVFAEETDGVPGVLNLLGALAAIGICLVTARSIKLKGRGWRSILLTIAVVWMVVVPLVVVCVRISGWELAWNANFVLSMLLLPLGFASQRCAAQFAKLGQVRGPDARDFDALLLRTFARDRDAAPIVRGMSFEAAICGFLQSRGYESLAVGQPWEVFPGGAAARVYLPMHGWERFVIRYVKLAKVILVVPGESLAVIWEQAVLKTFASGKQVILLCPYETKADRRHFDAYRKNVEGKFDLPSITESGVMVFDAAWTPKFIPLRLSGWQSKEEFYKEFAAKAEIKPVVRDRLD